MKGKGQSQPEIVADIRLNSCGSGIATILIPGELVTQRPTAGWAVAVRRLGL